MFIVANLCSPNSGTLTFVKKAALTADAISLLAIATICALGLLGIGPIQSHILAYTLFIGGGVILLSDAAILIYHAKNPRQGAHNSNSSEHESRFSNYSVSSLKTQKSTRAVENKEEKTNSPLKEKITTSAFAKNELPLASSYNEEFLPTVARPYGLLKALEISFKGTSKIQQQAHALDSHFYYQRVRGGGNCFYLSYLSGLLHHLVEDKEKCIEIISKVENHPQTSDSKNEFIHVLKNLQTIPTYENLYSILENEVKMKPLILFLREFAIYYALNEVDEGLIKYVIENSADLKKAITVKNLKTYCDHQIQYGVDVQSPEILMLHQYFFPFRMYDRFDVYKNNHKPSRNNGLRPDFSTDSPVVLMACGTNHFDCLIPKRH